MTSECTLYSVHFSSVSLRALKRVREREEREPDERELADTVSFDLSIYLNIFNYLSICE